ncbi:MAG: GCN5-related N-acetyltransferase [Marmoricola sp.]|nr:GCN5-related N-acetyltransferase [Marmoricola sp.]
MITCMRAMSELEWPKQTERLRLRPTVEADLDALWAIRRQESVGRWMTESSQDRDAFHARLMVPDHLAKTITLELEGRIIGDLMIAVEDAWSQGEVRDQARGVQAELGWCLDPAVEGHGYGTEAATELIRICFAELGLRRVTAACFADNEPSWRLMERIGMRREAHNVADSLHRDGRWLDGFVYAVLHDEWPAS